MRGCVRKDNFKGCNKEFLIFVENGGGESAVSLTGREKEYVDVVKRMNEANLLQQPFAIVSEFHGAAEKDASGRQSYHISL